MTKKLLFAFSFLLVTVALTAQNSKDYRTYGTANYDLSAGIVSDTLGNNYIFGTYQGTLNAGNSFTLQSQKSYTDFFLIKRDSTGQTIWAKSFGANDTTAGSAWYVESAIDITIDKNGDVYLMGDVNCSADINFGSITLLDNQTPAMKNAFVSKFDKNGNCKWLTVGKTNPNTSAEKIAVDGQKRTYIHSYAYGGEVFGTYTVTGSGNYVAMFDSVGTPLWAKTYNTNINALATDKNGYVYCAGTMASSASMGTVAITLKGNNDLLVSKIDSLGNVVWAVNEGNPANTVQGYAIERYNNRLYVTGGHSMPLTIGTSTINANNKIFFAAYDLQGALQTASGTPVSSSWATGANCDITLNKQNELFLLIGSSSSFSFGTSNINVPGVGSIILKYKAAGNEDWALGYLSSTNYGSNTTKIASDNYKHLYITGNFNGIMSVANSASLVANGSGNYDVFASIIDTRNATVGLKEISTTSFIYLFPNPATDFLNLTSNDNNLNYNYSITNELGQVITRGKTTSLQNAIDIRSLQNGIYFITLNPENENRISPSKKLIIAR